MVHLRSTVEVHFWGSRNREKGSEGVQISRFRARDPPFLGPKPENREKRGPIFIGFLEPTPPRLKKSWGGGGFLTFSNFYSPATRTPLFDQFCEKIVFGGCGSPESKTRKFHALLKIGGRVLSTPSSRGTVLQLHYRRNLRECDGRCVHGQR